MAIPNKPKSQLLQRALSDWITFKIKKNSWFNNRLKMHITHCNKYSEFKQELLTSIIITITKFILQQCYWMHVVIILHASNNFAHWLWPQQFDCNGPCGRPINAHAPLPVEYFYSECPQKLNSICMQCCTLQEIPCVRLPN